MMAASTAARLAFKRVSFFVDIYLAGGQDESTPNGQADGASSPVIIASVSTKLYYGVSCHLIRNLNISFHSILYYVA